MAAFAPMPSASVKIATIVNPGFFPKVRSPKRMSCSKFSIYDSSLFVTKRHHRIHAHGTARRHIARKQGDQEQQTRHRSERKWIGCADAKKQAVQELRQHQRSQHADRSEEHTSELQ